MKFDQWTAVFNGACEHLGARGIFIFDINTERRLNWLVQEPPVTSWFDKGNLLVLDVREHADEGVIWDIKIFERVGGDDYRLHTEEIREVSFSVEQIRAALRDRFRRVSVYDQQRARPSVRSGRLHFVLHKVTPLHRAHSATVAAPAQLFRRRGADVLAAALVSRP